MRLLRREFRIRRLPDPRLQPTIREARIFSAARSQFLYRFTGAISQAQPQRHGAHVEVLHLRHRYRLKYFCL